MPITPFIGVRISWLMLARNVLLARAAASAAFFAATSSRLVEVISSRSRLTYPPIAANHGSVTTSTTSCRISSAGSTVSGLLR